MDQALLLELMPNTRLAAAAGHAAATRLKWKPPRRWRSWAGATTAARPCRRRRRRQGAHARAARHPAAVEPARGAGRPGPGQPGCAAERQPDELPHRRRGRQRHRAVRHRRVPSPPRRTCSSSTACRRRWCREGERFRAMITRATPQAGDEGHAHATRHAARRGRRRWTSRPARRASWLPGYLTAPTTSAQARTEALVWGIAARDGLSGAQDALRVAAPAAGRAAHGTAGRAGAARRQHHPRRGTAYRLSSDGAPRGSGISLAATPRLAGGLPGVADWFRRYPCNCLEQQTSRAGPARRQGLGPAHRANPGLPG